jgi:hypothetical protein
VTHDIQLVVEGCVVVDDVVCDVSEVTGVVVVDVSEVVADDVVCDVSEVKGVVVVDVSEVEGVVETVVAVLTVDVQTLLN